MSFSKLYFAFGLAFIALSNAQIDLQTAKTYAVLGAQAITSTGNTVLNGNLGIFPLAATSVTGFQPPGVINGDIQAGNAIAQQAQADASRAYTVAAAFTPTRDLTGVDLGGLTLVPGVYFFSSSAQLTGTLTLDGVRSTTGVWVFQMGSTITTATSANVALIRGALAANVYWQVGSSATLGTSTNFAGNVLALTSITANSGVTVNGGLYALNAAVTMIDDQITAPSNETVVPICGGT